MTTFCEAHQISRKTFYAIRARTRTDGAVAALEPRTRRPNTSPTKVSEEVKRYALGVRAVLESSGLGHGPISVHDKMQAMGLSPVPSTASLARIFREAGVARLEPKKKPRSAWRRYAAASHVAWVETSQAAIVVFDWPRLLAPPVSGSTDHPPHGLGRSQRRCQSDLPDDTQIMKLTTAGTFLFDKVHYKVDGRHGLESVLIVTDRDKSTVADLHGEILIEHTRPSPGVSYVGNGRPCGTRHRTLKASPKS